MQNPPPPQRPRVDRAFALYYQSGSLVYVAPFTALMTSSSINANDGDRTMRGGISTDRPRYNTGESLPINDVATIAKIAVRVEVGLTGRSAVRVQPLLHFINGTFR